jgi:serine phosphatase RsbU (regulator of sigma subunit)
VESLVAGGTPLGVAPDAAYVNVRVEFPPGSRLVAFSDGLAEQRSPEGKPFGVERARGAIEAAGCAEEDVGSLVRALRGHAAIPEPLGFSDDVTIASVAIDSCDGASGAGVPLGGRC